MEDAILHLLGYTIEVIGYLVSLLISGIDIYFVLKKRQFHDYFRLLLLITLFAIFGISIVFLFRVAESNFIHLEKEKFMVLLAFQIFLNSVSLVVNILLNIERIFAMYYAKYYEHSQSTKIKVLIVIGVIVPSGLLTGSMFIDHDDIRNILTTSLTAAIPVVNASIPEIPFQTYFVVFRKSLKARTRRHSMHLTERFQISENLQTGKVMLIISGNSLCYMIAYFMLCSYSIFVTKIPIGYDTSPMTHLYAFLFIEEKLVVCVTILGVYRPLMRKCSRKVSIEPTNQQTDNYFQMMNAVWK